MKPSLAAANNFANSDITKKHEVLKKVKMLVVWKMEYPAILSFSGTYM